MLRDEALKAFDLWDKKIDIAVHALKDLPSIETKSLITNCFFFAHMLKLYIKNYFSTTPDFFSKFNNFFFKSFVFIYCVKTSLFQKFKILLKRAFNVFKNM